MHANVMTFELIFSLLICISHSPSHSKYFCKHSLFVSLSSIKSWIVTSEKEDKVARNGVIFSRYFLDAVCSIFQTTLDLLKWQILFQLEPPQTCPTHLTTHSAFHAIFKPQKWPKLFQLGPDLICQIHVQTACSSTGYSLKLETYKSAPGSRCCFCYNCC